MMLLKNTRTNFLLLQDVDAMVKLLFASDFLSQFSREMQRNLCDGMRISAFPPNTVIVEEGHIGQTLFLCISGSVALHKLNAKAASAESEGISKTNSVVEKYGSCSRVLGIGDSFGELAFVQGRAHPTTAFTRNTTILICIEREKLDAYTVQQVQAFVSSPREYIDASSISQFLCQCIADLTRIANVSRERDN